MSKVKQSNWKDALVLMRIPFSIYLMPVFWFALIQVEISLDSLIQIALVFAVYHFLIYPASNGYNSYFDKDEGSIGGVENPPPPNKQLFLLTVIFDSLAILLAFLMNGYFALMALTYITVSKAYSWDKIRLKKLPITSLLVVTFFQGCFTYLSIQKGIVGNIDWGSENLIFSIVATLFLMGSYPITQVYQHAEDANRGDKTLSLLMGIKGTFIFAGVCFALATILILLVFVSQGKFDSVIIYFLFTGPIAIYLSTWIKRVWNDPAQASYSNTMKMNKISSLCLSAAFIALKCLGNSSIF